MSFEMKYDTEGNPIKQAEFEQRLRPQMQVPETEIEQTEPIEAAEPEEVEQVEAAQPEEQEVEEVVEEPVRKAAKPTPAESFRELKAAKEREERERQRAERERDEYAAKLRELEQRAQQTKVSEPEEDYTLNPDDIVEGKHLTKVDKKLRNLEHQLKAYEQQVTLNNIQARLKSQYPDFDSVVNAENIDILRQDHPEIMKTLNASTDLFATGVTAYTMIEKLGISKRLQMQADTARIQKNAAKPRPSASVSPQYGDSPLAKANAFANGLTDELKEQLRKEMNAARSR